MVSLTIIIHSWLEEWEEAPAFTARDSLLLSVQPPMPRVLHPHLDSSSPSPR